MGADLSPPPCWLNLLSLQANAFSLCKLKPPLQAEAFLPCKLHISLLKNLLAKLPALSCLIAERIAVNRWAQIYLSPPLQCRLNLLSLQANAFSHCKLKPPLQAEAFLPCKLHISLLKNVLAKLPALSCLTAERIAVNRWAQIYLSPPKFSLQVEALNAGADTS